MWNRKKMKKDARADLRTNYLQCIIVSLVVVALMGTYSFVQSVTSSGAMQDVTEVVITGNNMGILDEFFVNLFGPNIESVERFLAINNPTKGVLATVAHNVTESGSIIFGVLNLVNQWVFGDSLVPGIIMTVGAVIYFLYWFFVQNLLTVGQHRFFLENRCYHATKSDRLFFVYRVHRVRQVSVAMFLRTLFIILWFLTIIGGFIMLYAYRLVPAVLAENPDISPIRALRLSRRLMRGSKWATFKLDMSFIGWNILSLFTFRLLDVLYVTPYVLATESELYMTLRAKYLERFPEEAVYLNDTSLQIPFEDEEDNEYPLTAYTIPYRRGNLIANHERSYSFLDIVMLFFSYSMIGYAYEVIYYIVRDGILINRGTLYGPWLPIYGVGGVVSLLLLRRFADRPIKTFFLSVLLCGTIEYITAWFLETYLHTKWWDYTGFFLNIQGRVCAEGLIVFGLGCCLGIYVLSPSLTNLFAKIPKRRRVLISSLLAAAFIGDVTYSAFVAPNVNGGDPSLSQ